MRLATIACSMPPEWIGPPKISCMPMMADTAAVGLNPCVQLPWLQDTASLVLGLLLLPLLTCNNGPSGHTEPQLMATEMP